MFNKLKLRLTLANVIIVVLIFAIVFSGVYVMMYDSITNQSEQIMKTLMFRIISGGNILDADFLKLLGNHSFIVVNLSGGGQIVDFMSYPIGTRLPGRIDIPGVGQLDTNKTSPGLPPLDKALRPGGRNNFRFSIGSDTASTVNKVAVIKRKSGPVVSSNGSTYRIMMLRGSENSMAVMLINVDYEYSLLKSLRYTLLVVALAGLVLVFLGSLFMAGKALKPIKAAWEKQKNFVADASHELRTPLSVMQTNLELVMDNREETVESQSKWLENIYMENKHMTRLVSDLLLLARTDSGQQLLEMKSFSLSTAVEEAVMPFLPVAKEKDIRMELSIDPDMDFFGDEARLKQLAVILLDNAVKYTPPGGRIAFELKDGNDSVEMIVADTGKGIAKEDIGKIFERFYRVDKARSTEDGGTGLGLSIASWIVKEHHGTINVDSTLGEGTTFRVTFHKNTKQS